jgi:hypothetical protein
MCVEPDVVHGCVGGEREKDGGSLGSDELVDFELIDLLLEDFEACISREVLDVTVSAVGEVHSLREVNGTKFICRAVHPPLILDVRLLADDAFLLSIDAVVLDETTMALVAHDVVLAAEQVHAELTNPHDSDEFVVIAEEVAA